MNKINLVLVLIIAGAFRFYNNTAIALWHDEAFSALYISKYGWGEMMHRIILDVHPPLYYVVLRFWGYLFSHSLLSLRGLSILLGVLTVWAGYVLVKQAFKNQNLAIFAALLLAINPFQVQYALEARMYTLGTFLILFSCYILLRAIEEKQSKKLWVGYGALVAACAYTHYFLLFSLVAQALYWFYVCVKTHRGKFYKSKEFLYGIGAYVLSVVLYLPWMPSFIEQNTRVQSGYWIGKPDAWAIPGTIWKIMFGGQGINRPVLVVATLLAIAMVSYIIRTYKTAAKWLMLAGLIVPFAAAIALSLKTAIYLDRYFVFASLFMAIAAALAIINIRPVAVRRGLAATLVVVSLVAFFKNWKDMDVKNLFTNRFENRKPGMAKASEIVNDQARDTDRIFVGSSFIFFTFQYYNRAPVKPLLLSDRLVEEIPHYAGTAILTNGDIQLTENGLVPSSAVSKGGNVWLVWTTGFGGSKPNVPGNWSEVFTKEYPDTPGFKGSIYVTEYHVR